MSRGIASRAAAALIVIVAAFVAACAPSKGARGSVISAAADTSAIVVPADAAAILALAARPGARATLVNAWATWCAPCREEFPALLRVMRRHPDVRLVLVSTDFPEQQHDAERFLAAHGVHDTTYMKSDGDQAFIDGLDTRWSGSLPATFVYDAQGRAIAFWEGAADSARFESAIAKALEAK